MNGLGTVLAILASAVIVLGGLGALVRAIWGLAQTIRDNSTATKDLGEKFDQFTPIVDTRLAALEARVAALEHPGA
jgi:hypothetical protein